MVLCRRGVGVLESVGLALTICLLSAGCGRAPGGGDAGLGASPTRTQAPASPSQACASTAIPSARKNMAFVYMANRQEALLFGGTDSTNRFLGDTWIWKAGCWSQQNLTQAPSARDWMAAAYDPVHGVVLVYGGRGWGGGQSYSDTWIWNGQTWTQVKVSAGQPLLFAAAVAGFDPVSQRPLLFGMVAGGGTETWAWNGSSWVHLSPTHSPDGREGASMAMDGSRGQLMMFGGRNPKRGSLNETWVWDGIDWHALSPATSPPVRFRAALGSLAAKRLVILWGGVGGQAGPGILGDVWQWDGTNWTQLASSLGARSDGAAIDAGSGVIFFGGDNVNGHYNDMSVFDGAKWSSA